MSAFPVIRVRRYHLPTPEINTYAHQMQQCEKRSAKLPLNREDVDLNRSQCSSRTPRPFSEASGSLRRFPPLGSRRSSQHATKVRKSSVVSSRRMSTLNLPGRKESMGLSGKFTQAMQGSLSENENTADFCGEVEYNNTENERRRRSKHDGFHILRESSSRADIAHGGKNLRRATVLSSVDPGQAYLLRALTALAINSITVPKSSAFQNEARLEAAVTHLAESCMPTKDLNQTNERPKSIDSDSDSGDSHRIDFDTPEHNNMSASNSNGHTSRAGAVERFQHGGKRDKINKLRNYLRTSGFGEPCVKTSSAALIAYDEQRLHKLLERMRKYCSPQRQEKLRLKARLDYEMSLMRGVSFCEQQGQAFFRSASMDMDNRDVQMLEEDMKYRAIQEMRRNATDPYIGEVPDLHAEATAENGKEQCQGETGHCVSRQIDEHDGGKINPGNTRSNNTVSGSQGHETDVMSGLLKSPLSKSELKERILTWLAEVSKATIASTGIEA